MPPSPPPSKPQASKTQASKPVYGKPEAPPSFWSKFMPWILAGFGVIMIGAMIAFSPKEKHLVCKNSSAAASLTSIGSCTEE